MKTFAKAFILLVVLSLSGCAAYHRMEGDYHYEQLSYNGAIEPYTKYLKRKTDPAAELRLADCYRRNSQPFLALPHYQKAISSRVATDADYLRYAQVLFCTNRGNEARVWLERYLNHLPDDPLATAMMASIDSMQVFKQDTGYFEVDRLGTNFNAGASNFSPAYYGEGVVFAGERKHSWLAGDAEWTGRDYLDLYYVKHDSAGGWLPAERLKGDINSIYHEGPMTFSSDAKRVYFTRNDFLHGKRGHGDDAMNNLKLYSARVNAEGGWEDVQELGMNNDDYSVGHPALSEDGLSLYFVSDMPGGHGGTDLYVCESRGADVWGTPKNLGDAINTPGDEMFPFIAKDGTLYFSSNGHAGLGGLDIFRTAAQGNAWAAPINLRHPINSTMDDFGLITDADVREGFLSSNRGSGQGVDNIFRFDRKDPKVNLEGVVINKLTRKPVSGAIVNMMVDHSNSFVFKSDATGKFSTDLELETAYHLVGNKEGYFSGSAEVSTVGQHKNKTYRVQIELDTLIIGKPIVLKNIYYDFDKWAIRPDAEPDLNNLVVIMEENPLIHIELSSHTDCRGSDKYNATLSQKRAQSAVDYIIAKGIRRDRIVAKGYGESRLVNGCKDKVECSEEEHQINRRTEFKVISIDAEEISEF